MNASAARQVLNLHSTTYEVKLYAAKPGDVVAGKYVEIDEQMVAFVQSFVKTT